jgi:hypothetical protein
MDKSDLVDLEDP